MKNNKPLNKNTSFAHPVIPSGAKRSRGIFPLTKCRRSLHSSTIVESVGMTTAKLVKKIKFVYFDVGGVLLFWEETLSALAKHHQKDVKEVYEVFHKYDDLTCRGIITPQQLSRGMHKDLRLIYNEELEISHLARKYFQPIIEMHRLIIKLAEKMPVGLLTNIYPGFLEMSFYHKFLPKLKYSAIIKSCDLGIIKPEKEIYLHAQKIAGVAPSEILFIDDYEKNTAAAKNLGWQAYTFDNTQISKSIKEIEKILHFNT